MSRGPDSQRSHSCASKRSQLPRPRQMTVAVLSLPSSARHRLPIKLTCASRNVRLQSRRGRVTTEMRAAPPFVAGICVAERPIVTIRGLQRACDHKDRSSLRSMRARGPTWQCLGDERERQYPLHPRPKEVLRGKAPDETSFPTEFSPLLVVPPTSLVSSTKTTSRIVMSRSQQRAHRW